jgi:xanthine/CO dehydrogenase XdhC/CoxF family maturation factor
MIGSRTKRATFTRYAANEGVDAQSLVFPIGASFPRDKRPEVIAAFAAAEIQTRMIERAHQGGSGAAGDRSFWPLEDRARTHSDADPPRPRKL